MFFNKLTYPYLPRPFWLMLLVAGLAFVATPATAAVTPVLSVPDEVDEEDTRVSKYTVSGLKPLLLN